MCHATELRKYDVVDYYKTRRNDKEKKKKTIEELEIQIFVILYGYFFTIFLCLQSLSAKPLSVRRREWYIEYFVNDFLSIVRLPLLD